MFLRRRLVVLESFGRMLADAGCVTGKPSILGVRQPKRRGSHYPLFNALLAFASLGEQPERRRNPQYLKSKCEYIPGKHCEEEIDERSNESFAEEFPRIADASIRGIRGRVLEHVLGVSSDEVIETGIKLGEYVGAASGENLRYGFEISSARRAELSLRRIVFAAGRTKHISIAAPFAFLSPNPTPVSRLIQFESGPADSRTRKAPPLFYSPSPQTRSSRTLSSRNGCHDHGSIARAVAFDEQD